ncbi:pyruvate/2-oxoglutarate dehydrogenase complex dihydrolipoamide dehydrogenase (E3) component [Silvibacterium bohemicum]|uniref:Pyruvate/2-oxoglutarate dehydrogenase complex dihydrolipoamide dehydrogenase (E3) component n=1 Tax=Silvibacterium bohemicum TaxID=1577686 RepID=A0A841JXG1_9BACT|nr:FAD-dependent oxidoreductase [Silvibacterium bohemicum]MBB6144429.1 pyruvate/2-oxoglutarate dehydrogenase complex dihydrolipoamide dehydrogenase (E3) component [Silvibacterium bohemicum]
MKDEQFSQNQDIEEYDLVILGSGEGGKYLSWTLAKEGKKVAVVERKYIGGSCPNIACLPSKNVIHSAKVASLVSRGAEFGICIHGYSIDGSAVRDRKRKMVDGLIDLHLKNYAGSGAELIMGTGRFVAQKTVEVTMNEGGRRRLRGKDVVIGTGTHATLGDIPGMSHVQPWTHVEALDSGVIPERLLVLGGGYVGLELAQAALRFGSKVTIIEHAPRLLPREDEDMSQAIESLLRDEGAEVLLGCEVMSVSGINGDSVGVFIGWDGRKETIVGTHLLVALGRTPNTAELNLDAAGVELTPSGYVKVNEHLQTTAPGVWAIGEVAGSPQFTHISFDDFRVIRDNLAGKSRTTTGRQVPYALFTDPELARIGLNEQEAKVAGVSYRLFKLPMIADLRARTLSETRGSMKALVSDDDQILGFTVFGVGAGEIMGAVQMAMLGKLPYTAVRDAIVTHPTLLEGLVGLFSSKPTEVSNS